MLVVVGKDVAVLPMFFFVLPMCPFAVGIDFGRYFWTVAVSSPGNVVKNPLLIAFIQVSNGWAP